MAVDRNSDVLRLAKAGGSGSGSGSSSYSSVVKHYRIYVKKPKGGTVTSDATDYVNPDKSIDCGSAGKTCAINVDEGTTVGLTAQPDGGYSFIRWGGACRSSSNGSGSGGGSGSANCSLSSVSGDKIVSAFFKTSVLKVTRTKGGLVEDESGGISCGTDPNAVPGDKKAGKLCQQNLEPNADNLVTLTATPNEGFVFKKWTGACSKSGSDSSCELSMEKARTVKAIFKKQ